MNISRWIDRHAEFSPDKAAIHSDGKVLGYAAFADRISRVSRVLKSVYRIGPGDRVAHLGLNSADMLAVFFACARLGAILVPLNWRLAPPEHAYVLDDAGAAVLIADAEFDEAVREATSLVRSSQVRSPQDQPCRLIGLGGALSDGPDMRDLIDALPAKGTSSGSEPGGDMSHPVLIVYTSGTTGRPKGAVLTQEAVFWNALQSLHMHDLTSRDHVLTVLPMFHVGGLNIQTLPALYAGATVTLHARFDAAATLDAISTLRPTLTVLVPATLDALIRHPDFAATDLSSLRLLTTGSCVVPQDLIETFTSRGLTVIQVYGSTETAPIAIYQRADGAPFKDGSTGRQGLHCDVRVVDDRGGPVPDGVDGEIVVRGPNVMTRYWRNAIATAGALKNGWYHTGDIGYRDADGIYVIHDRKKNMIISGGENIYPAEIERVLRTCPGVEDAVVVGRQDRRWGEAPVAVILRDAADTHGASLTAEEVVSFLDGRIARFKHPRKVIFVDAIPKNAMGKVQHHLVRDMIADGEP